MRLVSAIVASLTAFFCFFVSSAALPAKSAGGVHVMPVTPLDLRPEAAARSKSDVSLRQTAFHVKAEDRVIFRNKIDENTNAIDKKLDVLAEKHGVVGMSVAAFEHEKVVYRHTYGLRNIAQGLPATDDTKYRVASISKMVTAMLAIMLSEETGFSLDRDLRGVIPGMADPYFPAEPVTTRELIMHTSGLKDGKPYNEAVTQMVFPPLSALLTSPDMWLKEDKPGAEYEYSNFGAGVVSGVIESQTGTRFYHYAKERLFGPLLIDAGYSVHMIGRKNLIANIYTSNGTLTAEPERWRNMETVYAGIPVGEMYLLGHGDLFISAGDLAKIGMILAGDGTYMGRRYLPRYALDEMNSIILTEEEEGVARGFGTFAMTDILKDGTVYGHQGNAYGMISGLFYDPETKTGVVFLSNGCSLLKGDQGLYDVNRDMMSAVWRYLAPAAV